MTSRGREWLAANLPHQGPMNLLAEIVSWDAQGLRARATSHRDAANPLRRGGELPIACGIEYGAQAVAAHGALASLLAGIHDNGTPPARSAASKPGFIGAVRSVAFHAARLDDVESPLDIHVRSLGGGAGGLLYEFRVSAAGRALVEGRVTIVLNASLLPSEAGR